MALPKTSLVGVLAEIWGPQPSLNRQGLDVWYYIAYNRSMEQSKRKPPTTIRINPDVLHKARVAAVSDKKTLGRWLEEAIEEKIEREQKSSREGQR